MKTFEKRLKGMMKDREFKNKLYHRMLVIKNRCEREQAESDTAGSGVYVAPPSEETHERGPGGAVTPLLFLEPEQIPSKGTLLSAHGFSPDYEGRDLKYAAYIRELDKFDEEIAAAEARIRDESLSGDEVRQALNTVKERKAAKKAFIKAQLHEAASKIIESDFFLRRSQKLSRHYSSGGYRYVMAEWNPAAGSVASYELAIIVFSFLDVTANRNRIGVGTNSGFAADIDALEAALQVAMVAKAAMDAADTTTNKDNFRDACIPLHGLLSEILKDLRALRDKVKTSDYYLMGLPALGDNHHSPIPYPSEVMNLTITKTSLGRVYLEIRRPNGKKAKEYGVHGYEIRIVEIDDTTNEETYVWTEKCMSFFTTKSQCEIELGTANRGKHYFITVRAENTKGQKGPTSPTQGFMLG